MITTSDINRQHYPEINHTHVIEDYRERQLIVNFIRWLASAILELFEKPIKLIAILCMWWPVNLYG